MIEERLRLIGSLSRAWQHLKEKTRNINKLEFIANLRNKRLSFKLLLGYIETLGLAFLINSTNFNFIKGK